MIIHEMTLEECRDALAQASLARLGCDMGGQPYVVPVYLAYDGSCLFGFATMGYKIDCMRANPAILGWAQKYKRTRPLPDGNNRSAGVDEGGGRSIPEWDHYRSAGTNGRHQYVNDAVMPFYILHQTVIVVMGFYVVRLKAGVMIKYTLIVTATFAITLLLYDLVIRRTNLTRFLFGVKLKKKRPQVISASASGP